MNADRSISILYRSIIWLTLAAAAGSALMMIFSRFLARFPYDNF